MNKNDDYYHRRMHIEKVGKKLVDSALLKEARAENRKLESDKELLVETLKKLRLTSVWYSVDLIDNVLKEIK